jgi:hypothetical protein
MIIEGSVKSKATKRGSDKKIAAALGVDSCLTQMCGKLELNATRPTDYAILRELYWVFMGGEYSGGGSIVITNAKGEKCSYTSPTKDELKKIKSKKPVGVN